MGFGYYGSGKKFNKHLDPMIGEWSIEHRTKTKIEDENGMISFENNSTVYDVQSCSENPGAWNTSAQQGSHFNPDLLCSDAFAQPIQASWNADVFKFIKISLKECRPTSTKKCASRSKIDAFFRENNKVQFSLIDSYSESAERKLAVSSQILHTFINDLNYVQIDKRMRSKVDFLIRHGVEGQEKQDPKTLTKFHRLGNVQKSFELKQDDDPEILSAYIRLDQVRLSVKYRTYGLISWAAEIGGIANLTRLIFTVFIVSIARRLFINSVLGSMFLLANPQTKFAYGNNKFKSIGDSIKRTRTRRQSILLSQKTRRLTVTAGQLFGVKTDKTNLDLINEKEKSAYTALKLSILMQNKVSGEEMHSILANLLRSRVSFKSIFSTKTFLITQIITIYRFCCPCIYKYRMKGKYQTPQFKKVQIFRNGIKRYYQELDIVQLLKAVRLSKLLFTSTLKQRQRLLMQFQRSQVIPSASELETQSEDAENIVKNLTSLDPMQRCFALGKANKIMQTYKEDQLDNLDKRLLKGFYTDNKIELEPFEEKQINALDYNSQAKKQNVVPFAMSESSGIKSDSDFYDNNISIKSSRNSIIDSQKDLKSPKESEVIQQAEQLLTLTIDQDQEQTAIRIPTPEIKPSQLMPQTKETQVPIPFFADSSRKQRGRKELLFKGFKDMEQIKDIIDLPQPSKISRRSNR